MARNEEKARAMLNRWYRMKRSMNTADREEERPINVDKTSSIAECEKWRSEIVREIGDMVGEIQNAGLGEYKIRGLNDNINKVLKEKRAWDKRIKQLGGPDYTKLETKMFDNNGVELPGSGEYKYFGVAKD
jgi:pre-mRNA-splicing factor ISY1